MITTGTAQRVLTVLAECDDEILSGRREGERWLLRVWLRSFDGFGASNGQSLVGLFARLGLLLHDCARLTVLESHLENGLKGHRVRSGFGFNDFGALLDLYFVSGGGGL